MTAPDRPTVLVIGHGMVSLRFLECAVARGLHVSHRLVVIGEEGRAAYDRMHLSAFFDGTTAEELSLTPDGWLAEHGIELSLGTRALSIDRVSRTVKTDVGELVDFDMLVLATGSKPFVPPIDGNDAPGTFVYRTIDDLEAIADYAAGCRTGAVVGGGLLGLEAANALRLLGLTTHVVEFAPRLMPAQLDEGGAALLRKEIEVLDITVHCSKAAAAVVTSPDRGVTTGLSFADGSTLDADLVLFSAGIRPRDELPRDTGLTMGERGGVVIDDQCRTSDGRIFAIGEVACHSGKVYGLVAPGYLMAETVASVMASDPVVFTGADLSTKLKLIGARPNPSFFPALLVPARLPRPRCRMPPQNIDECRLPKERGRTYPDIISGITEGRIKALWIIGTNPVVSFPNRDELEYALSRLDLLVVQDGFHTPTTAMAHIALPTAIWGEKDGTFTNSERRVSRVRKAVE